jgi:hypothetical protein
MATSVSPWLAAAEAAQEHAVKLKDMHAHMKANPQHSLPFHSTCLFH